MVAFLWARIPKDKRVEWAERQDHADPGTIREHVPDEVKLVLVALQLSLGNDVLKHSSVPDFKAGPRRITSARCGY